MTSWKPVKIAYDVTNPSKGVDKTLSPIILMHGMSLTKDDWNNVDQLLADSTHRTVYKLDARNHGDSDWSDAFDFEIMGDDVNHFMEQHKIPKAILIGHSMGGKTAMEVAVKYPYKVEKLIIEDIPLKLKQEHITAVLTILEMKYKIVDTIPADVNLAEAKKIVKKELLDKVMAGYYKDSSNERTRDSYRIEIDLAKTDDGFRWKTNFKVILDEKLLTKIFQSQVTKTFDGATLFVCGSKSDFRVMDDKDEIHKIFPNAVIEVIANATHVVHAEYPEEFLKVCVDFIQAA